MSQGSNFPVFLSMYFVERTFLLVGDVVVQMIAWALSVIIQLGTVSISVVAIAHIAERSTEKALATYVTSVVGYHRHQIADVDLDADLAIPSHAAFFLSLNHSSSTA